MFPDRAFRRTIWAGSVAGRANSRYLADALKLRPEKFGPMRFSSSSFS